MPENNPAWLYDDRENEAKARREQDPNRGTILPLMKTEEGVEFAWPQFMKDMYNALSLPRDVLEGYDATTEDITNFALNTGAVGGGVSSIIAPDADLGMFLGKKAANADLNKYAEALRMKAANTDRDTIWKTTGWWEKPDGNWAFEIDDSQMEFGKPIRDQWDGNDRINAFNEPAETSWTEVPSSPKPNPAVAHWTEAVEHPELLKNYGDETPAELKGEFMTLIKDGEYGGVYSSRDDSIKASAPDEGSLKGVALHELQHAVQQTEGWEGKGTNPNWTTAMKNHAESKLPPEYKQAKHAERMYKEWWGIHEKGKENLVKFKDQLKQAETSGNANYVKTIKKIVENTETGLKESQAKLDGFSQMFSDALPKANIDEGDAIMAAYAERFGDDPFQTYQMEEGEQIARLTQKRRNLNEKQRRAIPPWEDFETPRTPDGPLEPKEEASWTQMDYDRFIQKYFSDKAKDNPEATLADFNEQWKKFTNGR